MPLGLRKIPIMGHKNTQIKFRYFFNYNQVTSDPDVRSSIQSSCSCADSPFLYPPAGHVVTGDLACIPDKGLQSLFTGLKLPQKSREKSLLPPAGLGRSEILAGRSEILAVAETRCELPRQLLLYCLYLSPIYLFPSYLYTMLCPF